ncbi:hypothetical protein B484DRAFT_458265 [Ochromonadaceae sp. CCMP2298]|nr:hypothetical protein B484DRAFT_458265 [Ochromonadaceae sp. CCMP2298]
MSGFTPLLWLWALLGLGCLPAGLAVPSFLSNCSYSYGTELFSALREQERRWSQSADLPPAQVHDESAPMEWAGPVSVLGLSPLPNGTASLLQINVGFGTTGTRSLFNKDSKSGRFAAGCHYFVCFGDAQNYNLPNHFYKMALCVSNSKHGQHWGQDRCRTQPWLEELKRLLLLSFSSKEMQGAGLQLYADTPAAYVFSEVLALVPLVAVQHSLRDPFIWALKRLQEHDDEVLCRPGSMSPQHELDGGAMHILPCLRGSEFLYDNLVNIRQYVGVRPPEIAQYLGAGEDASGFGGKGVLTGGQKLRLAEVGQWAARFNRYVLRHSHPARYEPVCVWDVDPEMPHIRSEQQ